MSIAPHIVVERALRVQREQWLDRAELERRPGGKYRITFSRVAARTS